MKFIIRFKSEFNNIPFFDRTLLLIGLSGVLLGIVGVLVSHDTYWLDFFDNLHWTCAFAVGALLARQGLRIARERGDPTLPWWFFFLGLVSYTVAQLIWAAQVYIHWTPFPGPSDLFFLMLGLALTMGFYAYGRPLFSKGKWRVVLLDTALLVIAMSVATMVFYLPRQGGFSLFQLGIMVAYPVGFGMAASLGLMIILEKRFRFNLRTSLLLFAILGDIALWNQWNLRIFADALISGSLLNILFSVFAILLGLGAAIWRPELAIDEAWDRFCESALRMMPLIMVTFAAMGVFLSLTLSGVSDVTKTAVMLGGLLLVVLATIRQVLTLKERDQLFDTLKDVEHGLKLNEFSLNHSRDALFRLDKEGRIKYVNEAACRHLGYTREELLCLSILDIDPEFSMETWENYWVTSLESGGARFESIHKAKDGRYVPVEVVTSLMEFSGELYCFASVRDITERKRSDEALRTLAETGSGEGEDILKIIVRQLALSYNIRYAIIGAIKPETKNVVDSLAIWADDDFIANISYSLEDTPYQDMTRDGVCFYPNDVQKLFPEHHQFIDMQVTSYLGVKLISKRNEVIGILALFDDKPMIETPQTLSLLNSLAVRAGIEIERRNSEAQQELSTRIFNDTHEAIVISDPDGTIVEVNPAFCEITGYSREEVLGKNPRILNSGKQRPEFYRDMWTSVIENGFWQGELWNRKKNGELFAEMLTITALKDANDKTSHYVSLFSDITQSKEQQEKLELIAHYDVLTKLPNRMLFSDRFGQAIAHSKRTNSLLAVCFLDLDNFKPVNDSYGHEAGDKLLVEVAKRIKSTIREEDTVSRQGGDEFTMLLGDIESFAQCEKLLGRLHHSLAQPYSINGHALTISASSGVTLYPRDNSDLDTLLRHADQAMYQAKLAGKNKFSLFDTEENQKLISKNKQLAEIQNALANNELCLYYQPKVNMRTGKIFGAEALIRWLHPEKELLTPLEFLPLIAGTELEIEIGDWVINQALKQMSLWQKQGLQLEVSVNIDSYHLLSSTFLTQLEAALIKHPEVERHCLQLEVLETGVLNDVMAISTIIKACQDSLGVSIGLDDFGTGYSSLTHLRNLSADTIKIDRSFVQNMLVDPSDHAIVNGVVNLAQSFNREVIAEGVESTEHGLMLLMMGCEQAQGYGIAHPMPAADFHAWVQDYQFNEQWIAKGKEMHVLNEKKLALLASSPQG